MFSKITRLSKPLLDHVFQLSSMSIEVCLLKKIPRFKMKVASSYCFKHYVQGNGCELFLNRISCFSSNQATTLLTMDKYAPEDTPNINSTCFKLNSLQLQALLQNYHCAPDEPFVPTVSEAPC